MAWWDKTVSSEMGLHIYNHMINVCEKEGAGTTRYAYRKKNLTPTSNYTQKLIWGGLQAWLQQLKLWNF